MFFRSELDALCRIYRRLANLGEDNTSGDEGENSQLSNLKVSTKIVSIIAQRKDLITIVVCLLIYRSLDWFYFDWKKQRELKIKLNLIYKCMICVYNFVNLK